MDMKQDLFADTTYGKIALMKIAATNPNFRLFSAGWMGDGRSREVMSVTGASFRESTRGKTKGQLTIKIPHTSQTVFVTAKEMIEFEAKSESNRMLK